MYFSIDSIENSKIEKGRFKNFVKLENRSFIILENPVIYYMTQNLAMSASLPRAMGWAKLCLKTVCRDVEKL